MRPEEIKEWQKAWKDEINCLNEQIKVQRQTACQLARLVQEQEKERNETVDSLNNECCTLKETIEELKSQVDSLTHHLADADKFICLKQMQGEYDAWRLQNEG